MTIKIDNPEIEQFFVNEFNITPLDPAKNSYKLKFDNLGEVNEDANPFADVDDVASYAKKLRESSWR